MKKTTQSLECTPRYASYSCCSIAQSCPTLCNPMDCSTPGFPVLHQLLELAQTHVHWVHPTVSSSVIPFSSCLQSCPASGSFQMSQFFSSGGQSVGASALSSVLPVNIQGWFPLGLTGLISLQSKGLKSLLQHQSSKASIFRHSDFFMVHLSHPYLTTGKTIALAIRNFVGRVMSLLLDILPRFVIAFLPRRKHLLISWLQTPSAVILESRKIKSLTVSFVSPSICHEVMGPDAMIFIFWILSFKPTCSLCTIS